VIRVITLSLYQTVELIVWR